MLQFLIHALQYVLDFVHNYMCCILCTNNYAYKKSIICGEFWIGFFFFFWLIGEFWIGGEGIWCKSSRSSWNWESKESFKGIKTPFLLKKKKKNSSYFPPPCICMTGQSIRSNAGSWTSTYWCNCKACRYFWWWKWYFPTHLVWFSIVLLYMIHDRILFHQL